MTTESLSDKEKMDAIVSSLQSEIASLKSDLKDKKDAERNEVIAEIAELAKELDEEFDAKSYEGMETSSLNIFRNQYRKLLELRSKVKRSEAQFVDRSSLNKFDDVSNGAVFDKVVDIVSTMWNLPILKKEHKEEVMYQHLAEGIQYEVN